MPDPRDNFSDKENALIRSALLEYARQYEEAASRQASVNVAVSDESYRRARQAEDLASIFNPNA
ncbi:MAG: hypothetical protein AAGF99_00255 [Bacteroidota bacterium]